MNTMKIKAGFAPYLPLVGSWIVLGLFLLTTLIIKPSPNPYDIVCAPLIFFCIALISFIWLKGFEIEIGSKTFSYRDGMYKRRTVRFSDIDSVADGYEYFENIGKKISVPRIIVVMKDPAVEPIVINSKIFHPFKLGGMEKCLRAKIEDCKKR